MTDQQNSEVPKETKGDHAHALVRSGLGVIPFAGTAAVELFNKVITPPLELRLDRWREMVGERLQELENADSIDIESLQQNEVFVSVVMQASQAAIRNHDKEKLEALRNAVLNTALEIDIRDDLKFMFLSFVDELTVTELKMLAVTNDPISYDKLSGEELSIEETKDKILNMAFPDRTENLDIYKLFAKNLHTKGLLNVDNFTLNFSSSGLPLKITTDLGESFLRFIMEPDLKNEELR